MDDIPDSFGIFGRTTMSIFNILKAKCGYKNCLLTASACQANYKEPVDLITKRPILLDLLTNELVGQKEIPIYSSKDIIKACKVVEKERACSTTDMNAVSSRTHCVVDLKLYRKKGNKVYLNSFKFLDLAGSERYGKNEGGVTGDKWGKVDGASKKNFPPELLEAIFTNISLVTFSQILISLQKGKTLTGGEKLPNADWKGTSITRILKTSLNGLAFSCFIFCIS
jgi:hypothetical protein